MFKMITKEIKMEGFLAWTGMTQPVSLTLRWCAVEYICLFE